MAAKCDSWHLVCLNALEPGHLSIGGTLIDVNPKHTRLNFLCFSLSKVQEQIVPPTSSQAQVVLWIEVAASNKTGSNCSLVTGSCPRKRSLHLNMSSEQRWLHQNKSNFTLDRGNCRIWLWPFSTDNCRNILICCWKFVNQSNFLSLYWFFWQIQ